MSYSPAMTHISVMLDEVMEFLKPIKDDIIVDGTFGRGGYSDRILTSADCKVIAIDRDPDVDSFANIIQEKFGQNRFSFIKGCFGDIETLLDKKVNGIVLDLGVSSMQLAEKERGFSFQEDAVLDMRMSKSGESAKDVVNSYSEKNLADIIYLYGDERNSRKIAKNIVMERKKNPINTTKQLADIISSVTKRTGKIHAATKTFQALRILVNDELGEIQKVLKSSFNILVPGGRLVVVSFHSLEDRIVKNFLRENKNLFEILTKKVVKPLFQEVKKNNKARSAVLRAAILKGGDNE